MEAVSSLIYGFGICLQPINLFYCFMGVLMGTLVGVLPGIGPAGAIALLIPVSIKLPPESSIIMLTGIMYGSSYGCSTTSILMNIPGEPSSIATCFDGYIMARKGRAGPALGISAFGSFIAGTICIFGLIFLAPVLAGFALNFGPPEYFSLMIFSFVILIFAIKGGMIKGFTMLALGLALGTIGLDPTTGDDRFTLGLPALIDGVGLVQAVIGLYGVSEILVSLEEFQGIEIFESKVKGLLPTLQDWKDSIFPILRATPIGFFLGIIPGIGVVLPTFLSYALEKKISKDPSKFGTGFIAGVAGPEAANNAASTGMLVPLLSLGIPAGASSALIFGALMIAGIQPGPLLIRESPQIFWGLVASLYVGNVMLLVLNLPLIGLWVKVLKTPYYLLSVSILIFCVLGSYAINYSAADIIIMTLFGLIGYVAKKTDYEVTPMVFGLVLGTIMENALRRSLILSHGSFSIFFSRPISLVLILIAIILMLSSFFLKRKKEFAKALEGESL